ncbi:class I SAM-dependent methyltransferase [Streptomyces sp. OfavH-34-F]|nr:class I SAM-dependent methyltransferase [Streptomyces sp. OfavH-34-F]MCG7522906.1 class I SAM-dependent methyltransferase [Streptomyces sp. OfavH-34-F]
MTYTARTEWEQHFSEGRGFRPVGEREREILAEHAPAPGGGRALDVGCGTGELAAYLVLLGYTVDAVDFADSALARAREEHAGVEGVRWLRLDIERDDPAPLHEEGYDLITLRLVWAFVRDRGRVLRGLGERLRDGGALVVITPTAESTPEERRGIALDEEEIAVLTAGWATVERLDADGLAVLVLRGPCPTGTRAVEKRPPTAHALTSALAVVTDDAGRVLHRRRDVGEAAGPADPCPGPCRLGRRAGRPRHARRRLPDRRLGPRRSHPGIRNGDRARRRPRPRRRRPGPNDRGRPVRRSGTHRAPSGAAAPARRGGPAAGRTGMTTHEAPPTAVFAPPRESSERARMRRRTLSRRAGDRWLRVVARPVNKAPGATWDGNARADALLPRSVPRPRLYDMAEWSADGYVYHAELSEYLPRPALAAGGPVLGRELDLPASWWADLREALAATATVPTTRTTVRQQWIDRHFTRLLGIPDPPIAWTTGHADLHFANLTGPLLVICDWEGWGRIPVGFDIGLLYAYSLLQPGTAARIRREFTHVLDTPAGRADEFVALAQLLQVTARGGHPDLAPHLARHAAYLTATPVP